MSFQRLAKKPKLVNLDDIPTDDPANYAHAAMSHDQHHKMLQELERKKMELSINVPTMDGQVRLRLRELQEPICLFGEGNVERRDRLRRLLLERLEQGEEEDWMEQDEPDETREEYYTE